MPTLTLIRENETPRDGWRLWVDETKTMVRGGSFKQLLANAKKHFEANKIPIFSLQERCVAYMCKVAPEKCTETAHLAHKPEARHLNLTDAIRFTKTMFSDLMNGRERVTQQIAEERASICATCQYNVPISGCEGCNRTTLQSAIKLFTGDKKTSLDASLQTCYWCGCFNKAQIWFPNEVLQSALTPDIKEQLPSTCWKKL